MPCAMPARSLLNLVDQCLGWTFCVGGERMMHQICQSEFIEKNVKLNELRTHIFMSTKAAASFTRNELAHALRKGPFQADLLIFRDQRHKRRQS
eukprot:symbB.v1.2.019028.t1/scaffold1541.1/size112753/10